jgi:hypothetical protein
MARAYTMPAVSSQDFLALYERCIDSGLRTHIIFCHHAGIHEISISCHLSTPPLDAHTPADVRRCRRWRQRASAAAAASPAGPPLHGAPHPTPPSPPTSTPPDATSPATITSLPAKRTRKAARRRCEAELLHESKMGEELQLCSFLRPARFHFCWSRQLLQHR